MTISKDIEGVNSIISKPVSVEPTTAEYILYMCIQKTHHNKTYSGPFGREKKLKQFKGIEYVQSIFFDLTKLSEKPVTKNI